MLRPWVFVFLLGAGALAGCAASPSASHAAQSVRVPLTVHVVPVGFATFDEAALRRTLPVVPDTFNEMPMYVTGRYENTSLQYDVHYEIDPAPESFAPALFSEAASLAHDATANGWLQSYDRAHGNRICPPAASALASPLASPPPCRNVQEIDAGGLQEWIHTHAAAYGLSFPKGSYTVFLLDSYTKGYLPKNTYHGYAMDDGADVSFTRYMRAWGGDYDFVWLDVGAEPSFYDYNPYAIYPDNGTALDVNRVDAPVWEYANDTAPLYANMARDVGDATHILWARNPVYPTTFSDHYLLQYTVILDDESTANPTSPLYNVHPQAVRAHTRLDDVRNAFSALAPWAQFDVNLTLIQLPAGDPGMEAALHDAESRGSADSVDLGVLRAYIRDHWSTYVPNLPGVQVIPFFGFFLNAPASDLYALSDSGPHGEALAVFAPLGGVLGCYRTVVYPCFSDDATGATYYWSLWNKLLVHEVGHSLGFTHAHDSGDIGPDGYERYVNNWLWDSTDSAMTYRHNRLAFDQFDRDFLYRSDATDLSGRVLGLSSPRDAVAQATHARDLLSHGDWQGAFESAYAGWKAAGRPAAAVPAVVAGTSESHDVHFAAGAFPLGFTPSAGGALYAPSAGLPPGVAPVTYDIPYTPPAGASEVHVEFAEAPAPTHEHWGAYLAVADSKGTFFSGTHTAKDDIYLEDLSRCQPHCTLEVAAYSGTNLDYSVKVTPLFPAH
ncbi:MAG: hypothetical protein ACYDBQ_05210 [Thermoplasmatota archaeon]